MTFARSCHSSAPLAPRRCSSVRSFWLCLSCLLLCIRTEYWSVLNLEVCKQTLAIAEVPVDLQRACVLFLLVIVRVIVYNLWNLRSDSALNAVACCVVVRVSAAGQGVSPGQKITPRPPTAAQLDDCKGSVGMMTCQTYTHPALVHAHFTISEEKGELSHTVQTTTATAR